LSHISNAIAELQHQKEVIDRALLALRGMGAANHQKHAANNSGPSVSRKHRLSAEGRARIAAAAKRRWAQKRAAQNGAAQKPGPAKKAAPAKKAKKRVLSAEARKKMSQASKKRWAAQKKKGA
jgi:hypothetical protein